MSDVMPSSKELLRDILAPHVDLALDLLKMVGDSESIDPGASSHRFQIAALIVFLAGVDKALTLAFGLLYIAGKIEWSWMVPHKKMKPPAGFIECQRGLTAKLLKLKELGVDMTHLQGLVDLRNMYVHDCRIYLGYTIGVDESGKVGLRPSGPTISYPLAPATFVRSGDLKYYAEHLVNAAGSFIDKSGWQNGWQAMVLKLDRLPENPEPEYTQIVSNYLDNDFENVDSLNRKFVGEGAKLLLE